MDNKTIYALSTVMGKSGIAVIRISGDNAFDFFDKMTNLDINKINPRKMYLTKIYNSVSRETLDNCLVIFFKGPNSFTGENIVEINCHGSKAVIKSIISSLSEIENFRLAEPGEYSRRAFYNGKMDLTQADGLADLIDAETAVQQQVAVKQIDGNLHNLYSAWREKLVKILSYIEAFIDFPDENIPENVVTEVENTVFKLKTEIQQYINNNVIEEKLKDGFNVVISGPTNAGKSSLINALAKRNVAIVSDVEGTTRDVIDVYTDIKGFPVIFSDTAGLRNASDSIEKIGIDMAKEKIANADFNIFLYDANKGIPEDYTVYLNKKESNFIVVANKVDLLTEEKLKNIPENCLKMSTKNNDDINKIVNIISDYFSDMYSKCSANLVTRQRYKESLFACVEILDNFNLHKEIELSAEDIRLACREIGKITGQVEVNEILDKIFSSFCIGK